MTETIAEFKLQWAGHVARQRYKTWTNRILHGALDKLKGVDADYSFGLTEAGSKRLKSEPNRKV